MRKEAIPTRNCGKSLKVSAAAAAALSISRNAKGSESAELRCCEQSRRSAGMMSRLLWLFFMTGIQQNIKRR